MSERRERREFTPEEEEASRRRFIERLTDWSEPGAVTIIRDGVPLEVEPLDEGGDPTPVTAVDVDEDGNIRMSDGTIIVPRD